MTVFVKPYGSCGPCYCRSDRETTF
jgi:hypothetical protein